MSSMTPLGRPSALSLRAAVLVTAVLASTAVGGWRAASMAAPNPGPHSLMVSGVTYNVAHAEQVVGLSDSDLGGMSHGIQSLVTDEKALIKVSLMVSAGDSPTSYDAGVLRAFAAGSPVAIAPVGGTFPSGRLSAHARVEGSVSFVVPRNGARLTLRALGDPRAVELLRVDRAPAGAGAKHDMSSMPGMPGTSTGAKTTATHH